MFKIFFLSIIFYQICFAQDDLNKKLGEQEEIEKTEELDPIINSLGKNFKFLNNLMAQLISKDQIFAIPLKNPISIPKWKPFPGKFEQIAIGEDKTAFGLTNKNEIYLFKERKWLRFPGTAKSICVRDINNIWALGNTDQIYHLDFIKKKWRAIPGRAKYISCGFDGTLVGIYRDEDAIKYNLPTGSLMRLENGKWMNISGQLDKIEVAQKNDIWGIKKSGSVWHFDGKRWEKIPGQMVSVSVAKDKTILGTGTNGGAYIWIGKEWINVPGVNLIDIKVVKNGFYMGLTSDGFVWKSTGPVKEIN